MNPVQSRGQNVKTKYLQGPKKDAYANILFVWSKHMVINPKKNLKIWKTQFL